MRTEVDFDQASLSVGCLSFCDDRSRYFAYTSYHPPAANHNTLHPADSHQRPEH